MSYSQDYITSPKTGRAIKIGGPTYMELLKSPRYGRELIKAPSPKKATAKPKTTKKGKGCSNQGKYKGLSKSEFCGPAGGSCEGTYPVNTPKRARAALAYARHAPNPEGIKSCVKKVAKSKGWMKEGKLKMK